MPPNEVLSVLVYIGVDANNIHCKKIKRNTMTSKCLDIDKTKKGVSCDRKPSCQMIGVSRSLYILRSKKLPQKES